MLEPRDRLPLFLAYGNLFALVESVDYLGRTNYESRSQEKKKKNKKNKKSCVTNPRQSVVEEDLMAVAFNAAPH